MTTSPSEHEATGAAPLTHHWAICDEYFARENGLQATCPGCGDEYVHPDFGRTHRESTDDYTCPLGTRGSWLAVPMWCENCPAKWYIVLGFHKGFTFLGAVAWNSAPTVAGPLCAGCGLPTWDAPDDGIQACSRCRAEAFDLPPMESQR